MNAGLRRIVRIVGSVVYKKRRLRGAARCASASSRAAVDFNSSPAPPTALSPPSFRAELPRLRRLRRGRARGRLPSIASTAISGSSFARPLCSISRASARASAAAVFASRCEQSMCSSSARRRTLPAAEAPVSLFQFSERARRVARGQRFACFGYNFVDSVRAASARRAAGLSAVRDLVEPRARRGRDEWNSAVVAERRQPRQPSEEGRRLGAQPRASRRERGGRDSPEPRRLYAGGLCRAGTTGRGRPQPSRP